LACQAEYPNGTASLSGNREATAGATDGNTATNTINDVVSNGLKSNQDLINNLIASTTEFDK